MAVQVRESIARGEEEMPRFRPLDPSEPLLLRAGTATVTVVDGAVRWIKAAGVETVRGIYGAVRDPDWGTIEPVFREYRGRVEEDAFEIRFVADCVREADGVDFMWRGTISGDRDGSVSFGFEGRVRAPFLTARIGLCVLQPPRLAGEAVDVETLFGRTNGRFPDLITPYMPFSNIIAMTYDRGKTYETHVGFSGDVFQMEDQRAFTDASFKVFSRPLELPQPYKVESGSRIEQNISVVHPRLDRSRFRAPLARKSAARDLVAVGEASGLRFPAIGSCQPPVDIDDDARVGASVRELGLAHLRTTVTCADANATGLLERAIAWAADVDAALEVVLVAAADDGRIDDVVGRLAASGVRVPRLLPVDPVRHTTSAALARRVEGAIRKARLKSRIVGASRGYLYQLIFEGVPADLVDAVGFPTNPQVHAFDEVSIVETIETLPVTVRTAAALATGKPVVVGPVSLRALFNPDQIGPELPPPQGGLPARFDRRQATLFAASWTLGSAAALSAAGVEALCLHEAAGWAGLVSARHKGLPQMPAQPGAILPVGRVVQALASLASAEMASVTAPLGIHAVAARERSGPLRVLLTNLGSEARQLTIQVAGGPRERWVVRSLESDAAGSADWTNVELMHGRLELPPTAVAILVAGDA